MDIHLKSIASVLLIILNCHIAVSSLFDGIYCGQQNCYDILGVTRQSSKSEIARNYRKLAKQYHPDLHRSQAAKTEAAQQFKIIANAYEILKDDESRTDYDYMLDNPDQYYAHYYRYYRRRVTPKVDVRIVAIITISLISMIQYYSWKQRYNTAIDYFMSLPKYRNRAIEIAKEDGIMSNDKTAKNRSKMTKDEINRIIRQIIEEKMDIQGAYAKPTIYDVLWVKIVIFPYTLIKYLYWYTAWIWQHNILKQPLNDDEKLYIIRKYMKLGEYQFNNYYLEKSKELLNRQLWLKDKFEEWKQEEAENAKQQLAVNNKYKQYRRYIKNHGVGRMTFDDS